MGTEKLKSIIEELSTFNQELESEKGSKYDLNPKKQIVKDLPQSQCKEKRKPQRLKPPAEKNPKKSRTCLNCQKKGHNIRTCKEINLPRSSPFLIQASSKVHKLATMKRKKKKRSNFKLKEVSERNLEREREKTPFSFSKLSTKDVVREDEGCYIHDVTKPKKAPQNT
ncbi:hypothetical protein ACMD2_13464 [Ananas comosus]|uniref:CCHC-type domain-containing protein n=1 Tax=Ananas comosus TaxID=4615 RepID=A0A199VKW1_ANACO|nr:hypothetical protein ACMD2_13464 [Ananas comosus]